MLQDRNRERKNEMILAWIRRYIVGIDFGCEEIFLGKAGQSITTD